MPAPTSVTPKQITAVSRPTARSVEAEIVAPINAPHPCSPHRTSTTDGPTPSVSRTNNGSRTKKMFTRIQPADVTISNSRRPGCSHVVTAPARRSWMETLGISPCWRTSGTHSRSIGASNADTRAIVYTRCAPDRSSSTALPMPPTTRAAWNAIARIELARTRRSSGTSSAVSADRAGSTVAHAVPMMNVAR
jgi:hypothetical protein